MRNKEEKIRKKKNEGVKHNVKAAREWGAPAAASLIKVSHFTA